MPPTPLKVHRSMSFTSEQSAASGAGEEEVEEDSPSSPASSSVPVEEMCLEDSLSVASSSSSIFLQPVSPPRSARRTARGGGGSRRVVCLATQTPLRSRRGLFPGTPKSRRLFEEEPFDPEASSPSAAAAALATRATLFAAARPTLRSLDLNHRHYDGSGSSFSSADQAEDSSMTTRPSNSTATTANALNASTLYRPPPDEQQPQQPSGSRKRSSAERRETKMTVTNHGYHNNMAMHLSPHISPNSFLTMDGRFVQSKNPFSSPMMMEDESYYAAATSASGAPGPALPVSFSDSNKTTTLPGVLPPRLRSYEGYSSQGRFSFTTCSPIREDEQHQPMETTNTTSSSSTTTTTTEDADTARASSASLHKVRRYNHSDDVVAATGQHLSSARSRLCIDTTMSRQEPTAADLNSSQEDASPTDVLSFPPPPTPVKARRRQGSGHRIEGYQPATPRGKRQQIRMLSSALASPSTSTNPSDAGVGRYNRGSRTPHPGSFLHHHHHHAAHHHLDDDDDSGCSLLPKSRFYSDFDIIGQLGKGSFGTVYKVLSRLDGCMYAIKEAQRKAKGAADRDRMLKEVYALAALSDQADTATFHIVRYHQAWMEDDRLYIQTELCTGTLADEIVHAGGRLTERRTYKAMREILVALDFLHRQQMVHLDIKPENIFLKNDQYKLGDFGLVTRASCQEDVEEGDSRYMSKELLAGDHSDLTKSDIFSLGATIYEICLARPLPMNGQEWQDMRAGILLPLPNTSPEMVGLIRNMMEPDFHRRPSAAELLKHPQLLSDEQKALIEEKSKVMQANMQLAAAQHQQAAAAAAGQFLPYPYPPQQPHHGGMFIPPPPPLPMKRGLRRANTWDGRTFDLS